MSLRKKATFLSVATFCLSLATNSVYAGKVSDDLREGYEAPKRLKELYKLTDDTKFDKKAQGAKLVRLQTIKQAAFSWGIQEGLYWRYGQIMEKLESQSVSLHAIFGFDKFLIDGKMLVPSVLKTERMYEQMDSSTARTVNVSFTLDKPARLVPQPPTWRDYLVRYIDKPQKPHAVIFPRTRAERRAWRESLERGWLEGVEQANDIFEIDLRRLNKELVGMYRFRELATMGYVTMPKITSSKYSVTRLDNGQTLQLNDVIYNITLQSGFTSSELWEPFFKDSKVNEND